MLVTDRLGSGSISSYLFNDYTIILSLTKGAVGFTVVTGADAKSVQLKNEEGETVTISAAKATVNADGTLTFTGRVWFHGEGTRTAKVRILDAYGWHDATTLEYVIK